MLNDETKQAIRDYYAIVAEQLPGFKPRFGQREMIGLIANAFARCHRDDYDAVQGENLAAIEGRTGVGKTVGYLVPGFVLALATGKKLVVSSATVALQEQLLLRDIPALLDLFPRKAEVNVVLAKGRARYVCPEKLANATGKSVKNDMFGGASWDRLPRKDELHTLNRLQTMLDQQAWSGDRDDLEFSVPDDLWHRATNDAIGCANRNCPSFSSCPFFAARKKMQSANVIVANHDFILSSLAVDSKSLPPARECLYIFDEAHHLPEIAVRRGACSHLVAGALGWIEKAAGACAKAGDLLKAPLLGVDVREAALQLVKHLVALQEELAHFPPLKESPVHRFPHGELDTVFSDSAQEILASAMKLVAALEAILGAVDESREDGTLDAETLNKLQSDLGFLLARASNVATVWAMFSKPSGKDPIAKWIEVKGDDFAISACPLSAATMLTDLLWDQVGAAVLTSATLTSLGSFHFLLSRTGLDRYEQATTAAVRSPFNYAEQGEILIPPMKSDPKQADAHTAEITQLLPALLEGHRGSLVLFASRKQMEAVYYDLPQQLQEGILMQGLVPKRQILASHTSLVMEGLSSTIFGLASFGEGVDLPGDLCQQVIITKIPFAPPDTPVEQAMQEWIERNGGNAFSDATLPKASLVLLQWIGRLIRTETDVGRVVFLDARIRTKNYGRKILAGLPDFRVSYKASSHKNTNAPSVTPV
jgi:ATP-dependent DNA helicase DinG